MSQKTGYWNVYAVLRNENGSGRPIAKVNARRMDKERADAAVARLLNGKENAIRAYATRA